MLQQENVGYTNDFSCYNDTVRNSCDMNMTHVTRP